MALLCAHRGMSVTVVEKAAEVYDLPRAIVMDDEIQRVFQGVGMMDRLAAITTPLKGAEFLAADGTRVIGLEIPAHVRPNGHPLTVCYYQPELEALLRTAAVEAGVRLLLGHTVEQVDEERGGVTAGVVGPDGAVTMLDARWLVAADGAASPIRKRLGLRFDDLGFDQDWLVVDTELLEPADGIAPPSLSSFVQQFCDPDRPATYVPGHARYRRWEFQLQPGETREQMIAPEQVWSLLAPWLMPSQARIVRAVVYRFHATVASAMRSGQVFLAGDAAHQMPPFLGQGLCSGVRDAANLAWKLAMVRDGLAGDVLLDTYEAERRPHATAVVDHAAETGRLIDQLAGRAEPASSTEAAYGGGRPFPHLLDGLLVPGHPLVGRQLPQPIVDGRLLDELIGTGFGLLARYDEDIPDAVRRGWGPIGARTVILAGEVLDRMSVPAGGVVIVRPDRYVAAVTADHDALMAAGERLLGGLGQPGG
jgi:3-(3-hydroxy-phenyl)propionate hydroxylase